MVLIGPVNICGGLFVELLLSWFVYERIRLNLINPRVLKIERGLHVKMLDSAPFTVRLSLRGRRKKGRGRGEGEKRESGEKGRDRLL